MNEPKPSRKALAALLVGIAALGAALFGVVGIPPAIVGIILSVSARKDPRTQKRGQATAALVCSAVALVLSCVAVITCTACLRRLGSGELQGQLSGCAQGCAQVCVDKFVESCAAACAN